MQDVIKKLVDIDEKAKLYNEETKKEKNKLELEIQKETEKIHDKYLEDAKNEVENEKKKIEAEGVAKFEKNAAKRKEQTEALKKKFDENADNWVDQIVDEVLNN